MASKRKCKHCSEYIKKEDGFISRNNMFFCDISHAVEWTKSEEAKKKISRIKKESEKQYRVETAKKKQSLKTYAAKMKELQVVFNELRRYQEFAWFKERGLQPVCMSCQNPLGNDQWCNGHFKTVGARPDLRFDPMNSYLQHNVRCNKNLSGDIEGYKKGLAIRFGELKAKLIIDYCEERKECHKYSDEEIEQTKKEWRAEIRRLKIILK